MKHFPNTLRVISILLTSMCEGVLGFQFFLKKISFLASYKQANFSFTTVISSGKGVQLHFMSHSGLHNSLPRSFPPWFSLATSAGDRNLFYHLVSRYLQSYVHCSFNLAYRVAFGNLFRQDYACSVAKQLRAYPFLFFTLKIFVNGKGSIKKSVLSTEGSQEMYFNERNGFATLRATGKLLNLKVHWKKMGMVSLSLFSSGGCWLSKPSETKNSRIRLC